MEATHPLPLASVGTGSSVRQPSHQCVYMQHSRSNRDHTRHSARRDSSDPTMLWCDPCTHTRALHATLITELVCQMGRHSSTFSHKLCLPPPELCRKEEGAKHSEDTHSHHISTLWPVDRGRGYYKHLLAYPALLGSSADLAIGTLGGLSKQGIPPLQEGRGEGSQCASTLAAGRCLDTRAARTLILE